MARPDPPRRHPVTTPLSVTLESPWLNPKLVDNPDFPRYFRATSSVLPISKEHVQASSLPFSVIISPGLVDPPLPADYSSGALVRCTKCSAFLCALSAINGSHWTCAMCGGTCLWLADESPLTDRAELRSQVVDLISPFSHFTAEPSFLFIFDLSLDALNAGFTQLAAASVLASLHRISDETFLTMMTISHELTIFDLRKDRRIVICELDEMEFSIAPCALRECRPAVRASLERLAKLTANAATPGNCLGSALEATARILSVIGGVVLAFIFGEPNVGPHAIAPRGKDEMVHEPSLFKMPEAASSHFYRRIA